jgi:perosamine synthetase
MEFFSTPINTETKDYVNRILESGFLSEGWMVETFEKELEDVFAMKNVVAVNSGTSALHLALVLAGVGAGDEVILPAQTFVATGLAVLYCGAKPVFADIGMDGNIDAEDVGKKITEKTKAVVAVSWGGNPCDLVNLSFILRKNGVHLVQDNAHALGATWGDSPISRFRGFSCYSFQAIKQLSTGDGGALTCDDWDYERAKRLRWFGIDRENDLPDETGERQYNLKEAGYKYHMNNLAAAVGLGNLHGFKERQERVQRIAEIYDEELRRDVMNGGMTVVRKKAGCSDFMRAMKSRDIPVSVVHVGIDRNDLFGGKQDLPIQRYWDEKHVCLPIHPGLTDEDVEKVVEAVKRGW